MNTKAINSTKSITQSAILLAIGTILHLLPGFVNGVKPDFMLVCVFLAIIINPSPSNAISVGLAGGILAGLTTNAPGGFLPNVVDKIVASIFVYLLIKIFSKSMTKPLTALGKALIFFLGTFVSGAIFISLMMATVGFPGDVSFSAMMMAIVLPTALLNILVGLFFDKIIGKYILN